MRSLGMGAGGAPLTVAPVARSLLPRRRGLARGLSRLKNVARGIRGLRKNVRLPPRRSSVSVSSPRDLNRPVRGAVSRSIMDAVKPRRVAWVLSFALMAVGSLVAHSLAYRVVEPQHEMRGHMMAETGHSYFVHWKTCVAICAAIVLLALLVSVFDRVRTGRAARLPMWLFALVPPVGFGVQEHLERFLHDGSFPWLASLEASFVVGVLLQFPFALAAWLAARALLALALGLVESLRSPPRPRLVSTELTVFRLLDVAPARIPALALGHGQRAPPAASR